MESLINALIATGWDVRLEYKVKKKAWFCEVSSSRGYGLVTDAKDAPCAIYQATLEAIKSSKAAIK